MKTLYKSHLKLLLKRKETLLLFLFSLFPFLLIVVGLFDTNFMQLSAPDSSMSFLTFFDAIINVQYQLFLPIVALIYLIVVATGDEIRQGKLILYKDIKRDKIIFSKIFSFFSIYFIYLLITLVTSLITYYTYLIRMPYTSGRFWESANEIQNISLLIIGVVFIVIIVIQLTTFFSIKWGNSATILLSSLFVLYSYIAPRLRFSQYILPNSYPQFFTGANFLEIIVLMGLNVLFFSGILSFLISYHFRKVEF